ncbi:ABC transporter permease [Natrarchaeobius sp. A-rgal3]|uniref:ABC transporter permease n=1 Tax=Natrarchaeobius versutus TaxID=1679078 RepID=UPI003510B10E
MWEWASGTIVNPRILPSFTETLSAIITLGTSSEVHFFASHTIFRGLSAAFLAFCVAIPVGVGMVRSDFVRRNMEPVISLTYPSPKSPLIPLVIFWLGMGHLSRIVLGFVSGILPMLISSYNGAKSVDRELVWSGRAMGLNGREEVYKIIFPAALPMILTGVRIGIIFSFVTVISSEMIMAQTGMGFLIMEYGALGQYPQVFATAFWIAVIVGTIDRTFLLTSRYLVRWSTEDVGGI